MREIVEFKARLTQVIASMKFAPRMSIHFRKYMDGIIFRKGAGSFESRGAGERGLGI